MPHDAVWMQSAAALQFSFHSVRRWVVALAWVRSNCEAGTGMQVEGSTLARLSLSRGSRRRS